MNNEVKILIAEDDPISSRILRKTLEQWGFAVVAVENGQEAWQLINEENPPRVLILDWIMPGMDGVTLCRKIRERGDEVYTFIILLTANSEKDQVISGLEAGADDYLVKPYNPVELRARITNGTRIIHMQQELIRTRDALKVQATHDYLTGLWNRATIFELLEMELARNSRDLKPTSVLMIDLDEFKSINDTYGHLVGDQILEEFARRLQQGVRSYDLVGRYGGDEFLIVLPNCSSKQALHLAQRIIDHIQAYPFETNIGPLEVKASIGVTTAEGRGIEEPDDLVSRSDEALYEAKRDARKEIAFLEMHPPVSPSTLTD